MLKQIGTKFCQVSCNLDIMSCGLMPIAHLTGFRIIMQTHLLECVRRCFQKGWTEKARSPWVWASPVHWLGLNKKDKASWAFVLVCFLPVNAVWAGISHTCHHAFLTRENYVLKLWAEINPSFFKMLLPFPCFLKMLLPFLPPRCSYPSFLEILQPFLSEDASTLPSSRCSHQVSVTAKGKVTSKNTLVNKLLWCKWFPFVAAAAAWFCFILRLDLTM